MVAKTFKNNVFLQFLPKTLNNQWSFAILSKHIEKHFVFCCFWNQIFANCNFLDLLVFFLFEVQKCEFVGPRPPPSQPPRHPATEPPVRPATQPLRRRAAPPPSPPCQSCQSAAPLPSRSAARFTAWTGHHASLLSILQTATTNRFCFDLVVAASQVDVMNHGDFTLSVNNNTLQRSLKWDATSRIGELKTPGMVWTQQMGASVRQEN